MKGREKETAGVVVQHMRMGNRWVGKGGWLPVGTIRTHYLKQHALVLSHPERVFFDSWSTGVDCMVYRIIRYHQLTIVITLFIFRLTRFLYDGSEIIPCWFNV